FARHLRNHGKQAVRIDRLAQGGASVHSPRDAQVAQDKGNRRLRREGGGRAHAARAAQHAAQGRRQGRPAFQPDERRDLRPGARLRTEPAPERLSAREARQPREMGAEGCGLPGCVHRRLRHRAGDAGDRGDQGIAQSVVSAGKTFLERLDSEARDLLLAVARPVAHAKSERLVRHGEPSRGAYILKDGAAEATVTLPGGEKLSVAKFGAGAVFGEMALIERGTCTATVTATEKLAGWFIEREDFRALVAQRVPAALRLQHALTVVLSDKLRSLNAKVLEVAAAEDTPAAKSNGVDPLAQVKRAKKASFDFKPFLPHLPVFEGFDAAEIAEVAAVANLLELSRGEKVFSVGQPSSACFIVVRGAVEIRARHEKRERRMAVLGP